MAQKFDPDYKITDGQSTFSAAFMNPILQDMDLRLNRLETGILIFSGMFPGVLVLSTRYAIFRILQKVNNVRVMVGVGTRPAGGDLVIDLLKGGEPAGGAVGTSLWDVAGSRPTILSTNTDGTIGPVAADGTNLPLAAGDQVAIDTNAVGAGSAAEDMWVAVYGEPIA